MATVSSVLHSADHGRAWHVEFDGELIVKDSNDPECDAARALLSRGITGTLVLLDPRSGKPRLYLNIEKAAGLRVKEGPLRLAPKESRPERAPTAETGSDGMSVPSDAVLVFVTEGGW